MGLVGGGRSGLGRALEAAALGLSSLFPPVCVLCARAVPPTTPPLCPICRTRLPRIHPPRCRRCGAPRAGPTRSDGACPDCADWPTDGPAVAAAFRYSGSAHDLVHALKYAGWTGLGDPMGRLMAEDARRIANGGSCTLVPVPLSAARLRERGYNQSDLLALGMRDATGWPVRPLLVRRRSGRTQAGSSRLGRAGNVVRVFELGPPGAGGVGSGASCPVLIVDDVVTTGATARACAAALRAADIPCLGTVAFARTLKRLDGCE